MRRGAALLAHRCAVAFARHQPDDERREWAYRAMFAWAERHFARRDR
jgi:hypothetical protein